MPAADSAFNNVETVVLAFLVACYALMWALHALRKRRPELQVGLPLAVGVGIRLAAIVGISATGLSSTLRGGDEVTFTDYAQHLASQPFGRGFLPHGIYQLHVVLFALELKIANFTQGGMRIIQVGLAMLGVLLIVAAVHDLAGGRAARLAAWLLALEPAAIFFNSALHKEPLMELASGLVVFGATKIWRQLSPLGILFCGLGGLIAVETRSYAGWFLVSAAILVLLHAALRNINRPIVAMPVIYAVVIIGFIATPVLLQASSKQNLAPLQQSQTANAAGTGQGTGGGANGSNLKLEQVDYSTRGKILTNLPKRIRDVVLRPYPWQLHDSSQRFGAVGTLVAWAGLLLLIRYAWRNRGRVFPLGAPFLYPMLFLLVAYSLSAGNAGTGFRYRTHLVTLGLALMIVLREHALKTSADDPVAEIEAFGAARDPLPRLAPSLPSAALDSARRV